MHTYTSVFTLQMAFPAKQADRFLEGVDSAISMLQQYGGSSQDPWLSCVLFPWTCHSVQYFNQARTPFL